MASAFRSISCASLVNLGQFFVVNDTTASGPDIRTRYITSLYFTFTILTTVGFGNVAAVTNYEKMFAIVAMMAGCTLKRLCHVLRHTVILRSWLIPITTSVCQSVVCLLRCAL